MEFSIFQYKMANINRQDANVAEDPERVNLLYLDSFESAIWTSRYDEHSDFQLVLPYKAEYLIFLQEETLIQLLGTDEVMFIDKVRIYDSEDRGPIMELSGKGIESLLDRRFNLDPFEWKDRGLQAVLNVMVKDEFGVTALPYFHNAWNLTGAYNGDPLTLAPRITKKVKYENFGSIVRDNLSKNNLSYRITLEQTVGSNTYKSAKFRIYSGADRTREQTANAVVIFSPEFGSLEEAEVVLSRENYKNTAWVQYKLDDKPASTQVSAFRWYSDTEVDHHFTREIYVDNSDVPDRSDFGETELVPYLQALRELGENELVKHQVEFIVDGNVPANCPFVFNQDYFLGDLVTVEVAYGFSQTQRVTEFIRSEDVTGYKEYPTLKSTQK